MEEWADKWCMEFHPGKCEVLTFTRKRKSIKRNYTLYGQVLKHVEIAKYLGIKFQEDMRWNHHISDVTGKASRTLGFLKRNLQVSSRQLKTTAYQTLVRPLIEYAPALWDPHPDNYKKGISLIEKVQRRAARWVTSRYGNRSSPTEMLAELEWPSLEVGPMSCHSLQGVHGTCGSRCRPVHHP